jgi:hypothetical protein
VLKACDLGHRVVVRRRLGPGPSGRTQFTDVLGELVSTGDDRLTVRTDDGAEIDIPTAEVRAAKRIPPRPVRYSEIAALELIADRAWPPPVVERLGEWRLRAADGWTNRANSALPVGESGLSLDAAVAACERWYADRGQPPMITVPLPLRRDLDALLTAQSWHPYPLVQVMVADLDRLVAATPTDPVDLDSAPSEALLASVGAHKRQCPAPRHPHRTDHVRFARVQDPGGACIPAVPWWWRLHLGLVTWPSRHGGGLAQRGRRPGGGRQARRDACRASGGGERAGAVRATGLPPPPPLPHLPPHLTVRRPRPSRYPPTVALS